MSDNDLTEQINNMNIESSTENVGAWDAIYNYIYPELKREYLRHELMYSMMSLDEESALTPVEQEREIERYRNEMMRVLQVRGMLRRLAGYRH